jgi:hypothetical protein
MEMNWNQARELLSQGKVVTRNAWNGFKGVFASDGVAYSIELDTGIASHAFVPYLIDFDAEDWEEVAGFDKEPHTVEVYGGETIDTIYFPCPEHPDGL